MIQLTIDINASVNMFTSENILKLTNSTN